MPKEGQQNCCFHEEWLRTSGLSSLEKRRLRNHVISLYSFGRRSGEGSVDLFSLGSCDRRYRNGSMLHQGGSDLTLGDISL